MLVLLGIILHVWMYAKFENSTFIRGQEERRNAGCFSWGTSRHSLALGEDVMAPLVTSNRLTR